MLNYLTTDIGSMINFTRLRPSTSLSDGRLGGLAWHVTYNRHFLGMDNLIDTSIKAFNNRAEES